MSKWLVLIAKRNNKKHRNNSSDQNAFLKPKNDKELSLCCNDCSAYQYPDIFSGYLYPQFFHLTFEHLVLNWLGFAISVLNVVSSFIIVFGSILLAIRYIRSKLRDPLTAIDFAPRARYLIAGLEILIGAEVINTAYTRTYEGFLVLLLTIGTRGLIVLLLHLEKKWGMTQ